jgi:hypothetical protein
LEEQHLGDQSIGNLVINLLTEKDDPIFQQAAVNVVGTFFATTLFDNVRNEGHEVLLIGF